MWVSVLSSILTLVMALYRQLWSEPAQLKRLQLKLASVKARQEVEAERLKAAYQRIEGEPFKGGQDLVDSLARSVKELRDPNEHPPKSS